MSNAQLSKAVRIVKRKLVPLRRLKNAAHNPPGRIDKQKLRELVDSMDMIGLLHPLTISPAEEIIDGHRRAAAAKLLGWKDIECNIVEEDAATVYASVNATPRRMGGSEALQVWLVNTMAVMPRMGARFAAMRADIGEALVKKIAKAGYSMRVYLTAQRICRYCDRDDSDTIRNVVQWLLNTAAIGQVMKAMEAGESAATIMRAVEKDKPIVFRLAIGE